MPLQLDSDMAVDVNAVFRWAFLERLPLNRKVRNLICMAVATLEWVDWFNNRRLLEPRQHPAGRGQRSATTLRWTNQPWRRDSNQIASGKPGAVQLIL